jgi:hypothetical protein
MRHEERLLFLGPGALFAYTLLERVCAHALGAWPSSSLIWYLNLQVFRPLRSLEYFFPIEQLPGGGELTHSTWIAAPLLALVCLALQLRSKLPVAIAAHVALFCSGAILYCSWLVFPETPVARFDVWKAPNFVAEIIFLTSLVSAAMSHRLYWREILLGGKLARDAR